MTVHRFRLYHSVAGESDLRPWLGQFTQNINAELPGEVDKEPTTLRETIDGEQYYATDYAFEWDEGKAHFWGNVTVYARDYCDWYRMGYHECQHDEETIIAEVDGESWTPDPGNPSALANADVVPESVAIYDSNGGVRTTYSVDHDAGTITADVDGTLELGQTYFVDYRYYENKVSGCGWQDSAENGTVPSYIEDMGT